ncbi:AAA family ATPase [Candidatus Halocynthiibacter alkanivorans]|uniref:AAA family ATPase n=1 Tax=Candidatus Halocynthiibacter alkanivorans TaxID=2267619 RepID=UPI001F44CB27|nr:AAA family ATPase [Candidatus Halocynthiibacter alkanivorans]
MTDDTVYNAENSDIPSVKEQRKLLQKLTVEAIETTMNECNAITVEGFLKKYKFGTSKKDWFRRAKGGALFPAKAIVGVAFRELPESRALSAAEFFKGFGEKEARDALAQLGFEVFETGNPLAELGDGSDTEVLALDPAAVTRWIARLCNFFPTFDRFDGPDPDFDARERDYKLEVATELRSALDRAATDQESADAIHSALAKSNLLPWRAYWPMSPKGDADRERLWPALRALANSTLGAPSGHPEALDAFGKAWVETVPQGKSDPARQIAEFLFLHLAPNHGIYIRHSVRQDLWLEAVGSRFPDHTSLAETYRNELRFMQAVRSAFEENGLAPRDMIDVQSALWVVHNYKDEDDGDATSPLLTRETIEAAMNAYDAYRETGEHGEVFDNFGEPRDYWVRSTRQRSDQVYPTKPLIGFIHGKTELNGGWGQKSDAAAQLHNSGFIIIDQDNGPIEPPERYDHLIRDADRIRFCALNYYIEPARERGEASVSIRAGTLANALFLGNRMRNVCQALKGEKFQELANVPPPTQAGANDSTTTTITFELRKHPPMETATNLILYGPPGTGKTYATAWEAVRLCVGDDTAETLRNDRDALMAEYRRLESEGRIEFLTFHQSLSYEEFVEGLRPSTGADESEGPGDTEGSVGFRLKCHEGIFKRISERARLDRGDNGGSQSLDRKQGVFKLSLIGADWQDQLATAKRNNRISWSFGAGIDWSAPEFEDFQAIKQLWLDNNPEADGRSADISGTWFFRGAVDHGSYVVLTVGKNRIVAFGQIAGDYEFQPDAGGLQHFRRVDWIWTDERGTDRSTFYPQKFSAFQPMYQLAKEKIDWDALDEIVFGGDTDHAHEKGHSVHEMSRRLEKEFPEVLITEFGGAKFDCEDLKLTSEPIGELFTLGAWPDTRDDTHRRLAQVVACCLAKKFPQGFDLKQYREALVRAGQIAGVEPSVGWEQHNMPTWASSPKQGWLVPAQSSVPATTPQGKMPNQNASSRAAGITSATNCDNYVLIIDEINRANISKVFGELITLLEADKRLGSPNEIRVQLPYSKKRFGVPPNLHIIGTMNTADRSIALLDTALRRRFTFQELMPDPSVLTEDVGGINLQILLSTINDRIEYLFDREHQIGHAYFTGCRSRGDVEDVMRHKVIPLLAEYFYEDWSKVAAVLGDGPGMGKKHFLESVSLQPPKGMPEDDLNGDKLRWSVKAEFDFSEFSA